MADKANPEHVTRTMVCRRVQAFRSRVTIRRLPAITSSVSIGEGVPMISAGRALASAAWSPATRSFSLEYRAGMGIICVFPA
jgi:hypothetical protein